MLRINSVGAVGAQVAPGRVVFEHRAEDHEQLRMQAVSGRTRESGKRPRLTSGLRGARCWGRTVSIDSEVRTLDHLNDLRHAHPSAIPTLPPSPPFRHSCAPLRHSRAPLRHSCAPSVIPAPPPSFPRPLHHSCTPSIIPAPPPSFLRPPPSFLRRQESMRPPNRATSLDPPDGPPEPPARRG